MAGRLRCLSPSVRIALTYGSVASSCAVTVEIIYLSERHLASRSTFILQRTSLLHTLYNSTIEHDSHTTSAYSLIAHIMAISNDKKVDIETEHTESIEPELGAVGKLGADDVPSIEEEAASKAAWLISITVSLGGCVYKDPMARNSGLTISVSSSVTTQATSPPCLSPSALAWAMCSLRASRSWSHP